uniref:Uncharacterized protein n=1 Tax=Stenotrophomonas maltophilia TaxID=40324 RepID=A0A0A0QY68_STEMA|nr:hypothetical protein [Stenotrophomonas maltophilia]
MPPFIASSLAPPRGCARYSAYPAFFTQYLVVAYKKRLPLLTTQTAEGRGQQSSLDGWVRSFLHAKFVGGRPLLHTPTCSNWLGFGDRMHFTTATSGLCEVWSNGRTP